MVLWSYGPMVLWSHGPVTGDSSVRDPSTGRIRLPSLPVKRPLPNQCLVHCHGRKPAAVCDRLSIEEPQCFMNSMKSY
jgi:hypothetical protein